MNHTIFMLEHDDDDRYITTAVFQENKFNVDFVFVSSEDELMLELNNRHATGKLPSLILLNYHLHLSSAPEVVQRLKADQKFNNIPCVVLSGVVREDLVQKCYDAGAASFIQKPDSEAETHQKISAFFNYWFKTVVLPAR